MTEYPGRPKGGGQLGPDNRNRGSAILLARLAWACGVGRARQASPPSCAIRLPCGHDRPWTGGRVVPCRYPKAGAAPPVRNEGVAACGADWPRQGRMRTWRIAGVWQGVTGHTCLRKARCNTRRCAALGARCRCWPTVFTSGRKGQSSGRKMQAMQVGLLKGQVVRGKREGARAA